MAALTPLLVDGMIVAASSALLAVAFWGVVSASLLVSPLFTYLGITTSPAPPGDGQVLNC